MVERKIKEEHLIIAPALIFLLGFFIYVLFYLIQNSLIFNGSISLKNYLFVFKQKSFLETLLRTILFVVVGTPLEVILGLLVALVLKSKLPFYRTVRSLSLLPFAIPTIVSAITILVIFDYPFGHINLILTGKYDFFPFAILKEPINWRSNEYFALMLAMLGKIWRDLPISTFILLNGIINISTDEIEAAKTLGAKNRHIFRYIFLPNLFYPIFTVLLLRSLEFWKEFIFPFILSGRFTLIATYIDELYHNWHLVGAASAVSIILLLLILVTVIIIKYIYNYFSKKVISIL